MLEAYSASRVPTVSAGDIDGSHGQCPWTLSAVSVLANEPGDGRWGSGREERGKPTRREGTSEMAFTDGSGEGDENARMKHSLAFVAVAEPRLRVIRCERPERRSGMMGGRVFRWLGWRCAQPRTKGSMSPVAGRGLRAAVCLRARRVRNTLTATTRLTTQPTTPPMIAPTGGEDLLEPAETAVEVELGKEMEPVEPGPMRGVG